MPKHNQEKFVDVSLQGSICCLTLDGWPEWRSVHEEVLHKDERMQGVRNRGGWGRQCEISRITGTCDSGLSCGNGGSGEMVVAAACVS